MRWTPERAEDLARRYHDAGETAEQIAAAYGLTPGAVRAKIQRSGLERGPVERGWTAERSALAAKLWMTGETAFTIAKRLGAVSEAAVKNHLRRRGLTAETPGRPSPGPAPITPEKRAKMVAGMHALPTWPGGWGSRPRKPKPEPKPRQPKVRAAPKQKPPPTPKQKPAPAPAPKPIRVAAAQPIKAPRPAPAPRPARAPAPIRVGPSDAELIAAALAAGRVTKAPPAHARGLSAMEQAFWVAGDAKSWREQGRKVAG